MIGAGPLRWFAPLLAAVASVAAGAIPPPPSPTATFSGPQLVCLPGFAIRLTAGERGERYDDDLLVLGPGPALSIRVQPAAQAADAFRAFRASRLLQPTFVPRVGSGQRHPVVVWPGDARRGWAYWFPQSAGPSPDYIVIVGNQFTGGPADYPSLRRVLTGDARRRICPQS